MAKPVIPDDQVQALIDAVPDVCDLKRISYWVPVGDLEVWVEGWCDKCLAGTVGQNMSPERRLEYIRDLTPEILLQKADARGMKLVRGGFVERDKAAKLYGVTYGIYRRR